MLSVPPESFKNRVRKQVRKRKTRSKYSSGKTVKTTAKVEEDYDLT